MTILCEKYHRQVGAGLGTAIGGKTHHICPKPALNPLVEKPIIFVQKLPSTLGYFRQLKTALIVRAIKADLPQSLQLL